MGLGCGLSFTGSSPEIWGRNAVSSRPEPSQPFLALDFCPSLPCPRCAVPCFSPSSSPPARWLQGGGNFTVGAKGK